MPGMYIQSPGPYGVSQYLCSLMPPGLPLPVQGRLCTAFEAVQNYGQGNSLSCIVNCRTLLEQFFKAIAPAGRNYIDGMLSATKEVLYNDKGKKLESRDAIFKY